MLLLSYDNMLYLCRTYVTRARVEQLYTEVQSSILVKTAQEEKVTFRPLGEILQCNFLVFFDQVNGPIYIFESNNIN